MVGVPFRGWFTKRYKRYYKNILKGADAFGLASSVPPRENTPEKHQITAQDLYFNREREGPGPQAGGIIGHYTREPPNQLKDPFAFLVNITICGKH